MSIKRKRCTRCGEMKPATGKAFYVGYGADPDGLTSECKKCLNARSAAYRREHAAEIHEMRLMQREEISAYNKAYYQANREAIWAKRAKLRAKRKREE